MLNNILNSTAKLQQTDQFTATSLSGVCLPDCFATMSHLHALSRRDEHVSAGPPGRAARV